MTTISHELAAELLFASGQVPGSPVEAARVIAREYRAHPDPADIARAMAAEYGEHWEVAAARMARCLQLAPARVEIPDALPPEVLRLLGCDHDDCASAGPFELVGRRLACPDHHAAMHDLVEGDDDDDH